MKTRDHVLDWLYLKFPMKGPICSIRVDVPITYRLVNTVFRKLISLVCIHWIAMWNQFFQLAFSALLYCLKGYPLIMWWKNVQLGCCDKGSSFVKIILHLHLAPDALCASTRIELPSLSHCQLKFEFKLQTLNSLTLHLIWITYDWVNSFILSMHAVFLSWALLFKLESKGWQD